jgi:cell division transport system permease protein
MGISSWRYYFRETLRSLRRNAWMSIASVGIVSVTMLIFGTFFLMVANLNNIMTGLESEVEVSVFLDKGIPQENILQIEKELKELDGVAEIRFVDKEEGLQSLAKEMQWTEEEMEVFVENPVPDAFYIKADSPDQVSKIAQEAAKLTGVEDVQYGKGTAEKLFALAKAVRYGGVLLIIGLALAAVFIISNTIKLTVFSRRKEIFIMKSVGATNWFIRWPFVLEGLVLGLLGGVIATLILYKSYVYLLIRMQELFPFINMVRDQEMIREILMLIIVSGAVLGMLGSGISLRKFLKV